MAVSTFPQHRQVPGAGLYPCCLSCFTLLVKKYFLALHSQYEACGSINPPVTSKPARRGWSTQGWTRTEIPASRVAVLGSAVCPTPRPWGGEGGDELRLQNIKYLELEGITEFSEELPSLPDVIPTTQNWSLVALVTSSCGSILSLVLLLPSQSSSIGMTLDPVLGCDLCDS